MTPTLAEAYLQERAEYVRQPTLDLDRQALQILPGMSQIARVRSQLGRSALATGGRAYTPAQVQLIAAAQTLRHALATQLAHAAGLRAHELFTLRPVEEQPASRHRTWSVTRFTGRADSVRYTVVGKGGLIREIAIPGSLAMQLEARRLPEPILMTDRRVYYTQYYELGGGKGWSESFRAASLRALEWSTGAHGLRQQLCPGADGGTSALGHRLPGGPGGGQPRDGTFSVGYHGGLFAMRWRRLYVALGAVVWVGMPWGLQGMLQQSGWTQQTADSWGPLCFHAWWLVWLLGGVGGWFLGRLGSGWTGIRAAQANVQAARDLLTRAQASWHAQQTTANAPSWRRPGQRSKQRSKRHSRRPLPLQTRSARPRSRNSTGRPGRRRKWPRRVPRLQMPNAAGGMPRPRPNAASANLPDFFLSVHTPLPNRVCRPTGGLALPSFMTVTARIYPRPCLASSRILRPLQRNRGAIGDADRSSTVTHHALWAVTSRL